MTLQRSLLGITILLLNRCARGLSPIQSLFRCRFDRVGLIICPLLLVGCSGTEVSRASTKSLPPEPTAPSHQPSFPRAPHSGTILYVSHVGHDQGHCPYRAPCRSLLFATEQATPGSTVLVEPGRYGNQVIHAVGRLGAPITVAAHGLVTMTRPEPADEALQSLALLRVVNSSYVTVQGFTVIGMKGRSDYIRTARPYGGEVVIEDHGALRPGVPARGVGVILSHLVVQHANNTCIKTEDSESGVIIGHNTVTDCGMPGSTLDHGIYVSGPNTTVLGNRVLGSTGFGIHVFGRDVGREVITKNRVSGAFYAGIIVYRGPAWITGNVIKDNGQGIRASAHMVIARNVIANNTLDNGRKHGYGIEFTSLGDDFIINNTMYQNGIELSGQAGPPPPEAPSEGAVVVQNNIIWGRDGGQLASPSLAVELRLRRNDFFNLAPPGGDKGADSLALNPRLVNPGVDFRVRPGSPMIGAGDRVPWGCASRTLGSYCFPYK